jgi:hypothetical protein
MVKTKKRTVRIKYGDRKYVVEEGTHDDNLFLINNEDKIRREIIDKYEKI